MKIIIVGAGRTGCSLIEALAGKNHDITVIEKQKERADAVTDKYNVTAMVGSGASRETLRAAGAATADYLIALTPVDEINLLSCMQARAVGTRYTAARVFQPDLATDRNVIEQEQGIDYIFNPKYDVAEEAMLSIGLPGIVKPVGVFGDCMQMITVKIVEGSPLAGKTLAEANRSLDARFVIVTVLREGKLHVPNGTFRIETGDRVGVASGIDDLMKNLKALGIVRNPAKKVMIVGGGITTGYLIEMLLAKKKKLTVIDTDLDRCRQLMQKYPTVRVSCGVGETADILEEEGIADMDAVVSLTDSDEANLVTSMYAWSQNVPSILTRIGSRGHLKLLQRVNLDITLSSSEISVNKLIRFIRNCEAGDAPNEIERYSTVADNKAEVLQFTAGEGFKKPGVLFKDPAFKLKKNVVIASIIHDGAFVIPRGNSSILPGDRVIVVSDKKNRIENLNEIFA
ncbi:MAG: Trk system potassium transporter TrkA [Lachnospiraceae bacterium]|nr:Trk system potassium transporter TrkA [Lachnospiraceae bacterium]